MEISPPLKNIYIFEWFKNPVKDIDGDPSFEDPVGQCPSYIYFRFLFQSVGDIARDARWENHSTNMFEIQLPIQ